MFKRYFLNTTCSIFAINYIIISETLQKHHVLVTCTCTVFYHWRRGRSRLSEWLLLEKTLFGLRISTRSPGPRHKDPADRLLSQSGAVRLCPVPSRPGSTIEVLRHSRKWKRPLWRFTAAAFGQTVRRGWNYYHVYWPGYVIIVIVCYLEIETKQTLPFRSQTSCCNITTAAAKMTATTRGVESENKQFRGTDGTYLSETECCVRFLCKFRVISYRYVHLSIMWSFQRRMILSSNTNTDGMLRWLWRAKHKQITIMFATCKQIQEMEHLT